ncbi:hypothetical protein [Mycolicibacillus trivialis]|uniref:Uncharacterized protein n=1 Tax=Mycolicibacillus trivialis TaxID=1798 RepID=A0A1X2EPM6_9MYCO|nr:hypothetical protein [Mycolicibacillus trivialis]ORX08083.1 hypothetical protein AWC30_04015 [Mycolicibacillus trivialis]
MSTTTQPVDSTFHYGDKRLIEGEWTTIGVEASVERHPSGKQTPFVTLSQRGELGFTDIGPLSCGEALELARVLVAAVDEAQRQAEEGQR